MDLLLVLCVGFILGWVVCNVYWHLVVIRILGGQRFAKPSQEIIPGVKHGLFTHDVNKKIKDVHEMGVKLRDSLQDKNKH